MCTNDFSTWKPHKNAKYIELDGVKDALVRVERLGKGYLWQCGRKFGHSDTLDEAKAWVEALATHYSIPTAQRWMTIR